MTGTLPRVARPRGTLTDEQLRRLTKAGKKRDDATAAYRAEVVAVLLEGGSFNEVRDATGLSKDTLQRWKREEIANRDDDSHGLRTALDHLAVCTDVCTCTDPAVACPSCLRKRDRHGWPKDWQSRVGA